MMVRFSPGRVGVMNQSVILYMGQSVRVTCDRLCSKAWGINQRPTVQFSGEDPDDYAFLADGELGEAPVNPGTYEGGQGKPLTPDAFPNKLCVRECERCDIARLDEPVTVRSFAGRVYNQPWKHEAPKK